MPSPVAFIIPALNEEAALAPMLDGLRAALDAAACADADIVVVDNGSSDATAAVARKHGARVISEPRRGYGQACLAGMAALSRDVEIVVFLDADGSDDPEDLVRLLTPVREGEADMVLGSRTAAARESGAFTPQQAFGNWLATGLMRVFFGARYTDLGPFRAIRRKALERLQMRDTNFGWTIEMQIKAHRFGLRVVEIPVNYRKRIAGESKISGNFVGTVLAGWKILWTIARHGLSSGR
ncbi:MAG TPA: glycosyltransferase family 2 protein [Candidatus Acidoferrales bacterium]|jgi:glycosyltransferase involved in cell wall biosynthesis|nr:glycosyltransferase family 2 protein [Candidatus Acidoferrales bacterium]